MVATNPATDAAVNGAAAVPEILRELGNHDLGSPLSRVRNLSVPVDPLRRYWMGKPPFEPRGDDAHLAGDLESLLQWAYGVRASEWEQGMVARMAPSAGALYPSELLVLAELGGAWRLLYHHAPSRALYPVPVSGAGALAAHLGLARGGQAVLVVSVLWRTLQRYGARGYRYCLMDAAHVATQLTWAVGHFGGEARLRPDWVTREAQRALDLPCGEALVTAVELKVGAGPVPAPDCTAGPLPAASFAPGIEQPPSLSPVLRRALAFHDRTLSVSAPPGAIEPPPPPAPFPEIARRRCSAKGFLPGFLTQEAHRVLLQAARHFRPPLQPSPPLSMWALALRVDGTPCGQAMELSARGDRPLPGLTGDPAELGDAVARACQHQQLLRDCALVLAVAAPLAELALLEHAGYRHLALNVGILCAHLYAQSAALGVGTTSIGGFFDGEVSSLLGGPGHHLIVVQAFGTPDQSVLKLDRARLVRSAGSHAHGLRSSKVTP